MTRITIDVRWNVGPLWIVEKNTDKIAYSCLFVWPFLQQWQRVLRHIRSSLQFLSEARKRVDEINNSHSSFPFFHQPISKLAFTSHRTIRSVTCNGISIFRRLLSRSFQCFDLNPLFAIRCLVTRALNREIGEYGETRLRLDSFRIGFSKIGRVCV